ncbi:MAG: prephenate dehydrogenase/arogenate dehydrogenase family protein, partial [Actinomycetota bacterium]
MSARGARVVGAGLIGTSIALRLKKIGWRVDLSDSNPTAQKLAQDLLGENQAPSAIHSSAIEFVIVATPPEQVIPTLLTERKKHSQAIFIDVSSTKTNTQRE